MEKYKITIEVRDEHGKIINDEDGVKQPSISYNVEMSPDNMEFNLPYLGKQLKAFMPNRQINIDASVFNTISSTYMVMYSYYVSENRFVKHS